MSVLGKVRDFTLRRITIKIYGRVVCHLTTWMILLHRQRELLRLVAQNGTIHQGYYMYVQNTRKPQNTTGSLLSLEGPAFGYVR